MKPTFVVRFRYNWMRNGEELEISGRTRIRMVSGSGTLVIDEAVKIHEGVYQCHASNDLGTAVTIKSLLRMAGRRAYKQINVTIICRYKFHQPIKYCEIFCFLLFYFAS